MGISIVQIGTADIGDTDFANPSLPSSTVGNLIVVLAAGKQQPSTPTCTSSGGNTYTLRLLANDGSNLRWIAVWTAVATTIGGDSPTVQLIGSTISAQIVEYTGQSNSFGTAVTASGHGGTPAPGNDTISSGSLIIALMIAPHFAGYTPGTPTGFTNLFTNAGSFSGDLEGSYAIGPSSPTNPTWASYGGSSNWVAGQVEILAAPPATAQPPLLRAHDQPPTQTYPLPDYWQEWEAYTQRSYVQFYIPTKPTTKQASQRVDPLPDYVDTAFRQHRIWPLPVAYVPTPPASRQPSQQLSYVLPDYWQEWEAIRQPPFGQWFKPPLPPLRLISQRFDALPEYNDVWYKHRNTQPVPVSYIPTAPTSRQASQRWDDSFHYEDIWWQHYVRIQLQSLILTAQDGLYGIANTIVGSGQDGQFRVQNNIAGYNVWIGVGVLPDLIGGTPMFSASLPISIALTPPGSGTQTFYTVVTTQDVYGLNSQNQDYITITIDYLGNLVLAPISAPQNLMLVPLAGSMLRVLATYPAVLTDVDPANVWKVWLDTVPPTTGDVPVATAVVSGQILQVNIGPYVAGTYYALVALYRASDGVLSNTINGSVEIAAAPAELTAVPGGYQQP